jgi:hypothetical protein
VIGTGEGIAGNLILSREHDFAETNDSGPVLELWSWWRLK